MVDVIHVLAGQEDALVATCVAALYRGELVVLPTDTVYGVAAHPARADAVERIYSAKLRDKGKPIPLLAGSLDAVERAGARLSPVERRLAEVFWPGALTLVLRVGDGTEGIRVPACEVTRRVIDASGGVLRVTSANRSGCPDASTVAEALQDLAEHVSVAVDAGPTGGGSPSTVARVVGGRLDVLRPGALSREELETAMSERMERP